MHIEEILVAGGFATFLLVHDKLRRYVNNKQLQEEGLTDSSDLIDVITKLQTRKLTDDEITLIQDGDINIDFLLKIPKIFYGFIKYWVTDKPNFVNVLLNPSLNGEYTIRVQLEYNEGKRSRTYSVHDKTAESLRKSLEEAIQFLEKRGYRIGLIS